MERRPIPFGDLLIQQPENQVICSAVSAFNWLKIAGALIRDDAGDSLINKVVKTRIPLQESDLQDLTKGYGFKMTNYFPVEEHVTVNDMVNDINSLLDQSPLLLNISTHLSKKPSAAQPSISAKDMKDHEGKIITHAVVAAKQSDNQVLIIDPYDPMRPEEFVISDGEEKLRFLTWAFSSFYQYRLGKENKLTNKESILQTAQKELNRPELVKKGGINMFGFLQTKIRFLKPL